MHPSNTLLLPVLHRQAERLLRAQIEAQAKELRPDERQRFLSKQWQAAIDNITDKLALSYRDVPTLSSWDTDVLRKSVKCWVVFLAGEANYMLGISDFSVGATLVELGRPVAFTAISPATQHEIHGHHNDGVFLNGYRVRRTLSKVESKLCVILGPERHASEDLEGFQFVRQSGNELEDMLMVLGGRAQKAFGEPGDNTLKTLIQHFLTP